MLIAAGPEKSCPSSCSGASPSRASSLCRNRVRRSKHSPTASCGDPDRLPDQHPTEAVRHAEPLSRLVLGGVYLNKVEHHRNRVGIHHGSLQGCPRGSSSSGRVVRVISKECGCDGTQGAHERGEHQVLAFVVGEPTPAWPWPPRHRASQGCGGLFSSKDAVYPARAASRLAPNLDPD